MSKVRNIFTSDFGWIIILVILILVNIVAARIHARVDLTKEKRYTLSSATKNIVENLDDDLQIDVFLSGDFPAGFRKLANSTEEFLQLLKDENGSRVHYNFISPQEELPGVPGKTYEDTFLQTDHMVRNIRYAC